MSIALGDLAVRFGCELRGDPDIRVDRVASLSQATAGSLTFLANPRLAPQLAATGASAVVLDPRSASACSVAALVTKNPHVVFARIAALLHPLPLLRPGVHASAQIDPGAQIDPSAEIAPYCVIGAGSVIGPRCYVGPQSVIGNGVQLGADGRLLARVTLLDGVQLGERVLIHPGAVIGSDGFGLAREGARWVKVPQVGSVRIGDDVEIGANTTIDRGAIGDTEIGEGVKLDNQIQVAHNVQIGAHTAIAACTGISGSARIGARCMIGGASAFAGHITICDDVVIGGFSMVTGNVREPGIYAGGLPLEPQRRWRRIVARLRRLADREPSAASGSRSDETQQETDHE